MSSNPSNPQLTAARALVQLLTTHPEMSFVKWAVTDSGLTGHCWDAPAGTAESIVDALGGQVVPGSQPCLVPGRTSRIVFTDFQDVRLSVVVYSLPAEASAVAA